MTTKFATLTASGILEIMSEGMVIESRPFSGDLAKHLSRNGYRSPKGFRQVPAGHWLWETHTHFAEIEYDL